MEGASELFTMMIQFMQAMGIYTIVRDGFFAMVILGVTFFVVRRIGGGS